MRRAHVIAHLILRWFLTSHSGSIHQIIIYKQWLGYISMKRRVAKYNLWLNIALFRGFGEFHQPTCALPNDLLSIHASRALFLLAFASPR